MAVAGVMDTPVVAIMVPKSLQILGWGSAGTWRSVEGHGRIEGRTRSGGLGKYARSSVSVGRADVGSYEPISEGLGMEQTPQVELR
jgi:hypothetical protein